MVGEELLLLILKAFLQFAQYMRLNSTNVFAVRVLAAKLPLLQPLAVDPLLLLLFFFFHPRCVFKL